MRITQSTNVKAFEEEWSSWLGVNYSVFVNSGSSANLLMVAALFYLKKNPLSAGSEVIVPAVSWSTTYFPLQQYGIKRVFVDITIDTFNIDPKKIKCHFWLLKRTAKSKNVEIFEVTSGPKRTKNSRESTFSLIFNTLLFGFWAPKGAPTNKTT